jgi:hypothetical protein
VGCGGGGSVTMAVAVCSEIEGAVCRAGGWDGENVCAGADRRTGEEDADVIDGPDRAGAWLVDDAVG